MSDNDPFLVIASSNSLISRQWNLPPIREFCQYMLRIMSCNCLFNYAIVVLYSLVSREPYFAFIHSIISFPMAIFFFLFVSFLLGIGGLLYCICGVGILILAVMGGFLRMIAFVEVFLARHLLCMKDTLDYPDYWKDFVDRTQQQQQQQRQREQQQNKKKKKKKSSNNKNNNNKKKKKKKNQLISNSPSPPFTRIKGGTMADVYSKLLYSEEDILYIPINNNNNNNNNNNRKEQNMIQSVNSYVGDDIDFPDCHSSNSSSEEDESDDEDLFLNEHRKRSMGSPSETNNYYYQQYGTMMSRSLDTVSPQYYGRPATAADLLLYRKESIAALSPKNTKRSTKNPILKTNINVQRGRSLTDSTLQRENSIQRQQNGEALVHNSSNYYLRSLFKKETWRHMSRSIISYVFDADVGFALLYIVVKLPVSALTFVATIFLIGLPLLLVSTPLIHVLCQHLEHQSYYCSIMLYPSAFHFEWLQLVSWLFSLIYNDIGNVVACLLGCIILPFCVFLLIPITRMSKDAVTLIGKDLETPTLDDDDDDENDHR
jgi:hypothetical protein